MTISLISSFNSVKFYSGITLMCIKYLKLRLPVAEETFHVVFDQ